MSEQPFILPDRNEDLRLQAKIAKDIGSLSLDPLRFIKYAYDWGHGELEGSTGPYAWQTEILQLIGDHFKSKKTRHQPLRIAVASGNGIGKSANLAQICHWGLSTCEGCRIQVTAGTGTQLRTKTLPEMQKWFRLGINENWWNIGTEAVSHKSEKQKDRWRMDLVTWDEANPDAFQGLHNKRRRIIMVFDEASAISQIIWLRAQKVTTDADTEIIWLAYGNPTVNDGAFSECFGRDAYRWKTFQIDSRKVEGTNKEELQKDVERYGEDSDYIRYSVRGEFPRAGSNQFIPSDVVSACRKYPAQGFETLPKILSVDVARHGVNETVIGIRQGRLFQILKVGRGWDTPVTTAQTADCITSHSPDAVVVDGDGIGGAVVDELKLLGYKAPEYHIHEFHGGATPFDPQMWFNRRAECWGLARDWLKAGAQIPDDPQLERQLTQPTFFITRGKVQHGSICIEHKDDMMKRGLESPDRADCLIMTFAVKLSSKRKDKPKPPSATTNWS